MKSFEEVTVPESLAKAVNTVIDCLTAEKKLLGMPRAHRNTAVMNRYEKVRKHLYYLICDGVNAALDSDDAAEKSAATDISLYLSGAQIDPYGRKLDKNGKYEGFSTKMQTMFAEQLKTLQLDVFFNKFKTVHDRICNLLGLRNFDKNSVRYQPMKEARSATDDAFDELATIINGDYARTKDETFKTIINALNGCEHDWCIEHNHVPAGKQGKDKTNAEAKNKNKDGKTDLAPDKDKQPTKDGETQQDEPTKLSPADDDTAHEQPSDGGDKPNDNPQPSTEPANGGDNDAGKGLRPAQ
jgi:hypothetical protein